MSEIRVGGQLLNLIRGVIALVLVSIIDNQNKFLMEVATEVKESRQGYFV